MLCAFDAETGLTLARTGQPDLILMDIMLPGMDGLAATALLKADPATAAIPIIALTSLLTKEDEAKAMAAGCDAYIAQPFLRQQLEATIEDLLKAAIDNFLPLAKNIQAQPAPVVSVLAPHPPVVHRKRRILIVEDSADLRDGLKALLEHLGHEVAVAEDGLEGAARLLELRPDVALVDVGLPGIDGYELARRVRAAPGGDELYLVALTGHGGPDEKAKAESAGFDLHFTKPIDLNELPQVVNRSRTPNADTRGPAHSKRHQTATLARPAVN